MIRQPCTNLNHRLRITPNNTVNSLVHLSSRKLSGKARRLSTSGGIPTGAFSRLQAIIRLEAIAIRLEANAIRLEAIAIGLETTAIHRLEATASRLEEAIASRLEAIAVRLEAIPTEAFSRLQDASSMSVTMDKSCDVLLDPVSLARHQPPGKHSRPTIARPTNKKLLI